MPDFAMFELGIFVDLLLNGNLACILWRNCLFSSKGVIRNFLHQLYIH